MGLLILSKPQLPQPPEIQRGTDWNSIWKAFQVVGKHFKTDTTFLQSYLNRVYNAIVPLQFPSVPVSSTPYTVQATDVNLAVSAGSGAASVINLPSATGAGRTLVIEKMDSGNQQINITANSADTINGLPMFSLFVQGDAVMLSDVAANKWQAVGQFTGFRLTPATINNSQSPYTVGALDVFLAASASASAATVVNLPASNGHGRLLVVQKADNNPFPITVTPNGSDTIGGGTTWNVRGQYQSVMLADAAQGVWQVIAQGSAGLDLGVSMVPFSQSPYAVQAQDAFIAIGGNLSTTPSTVNLPPAISSGRALFIYNLGTQGGFGAGNFISIVTSASDTINFLPSPLNNSSPGDVKRLIDATAGGWLSF